MLSINNFSINLEVSRLWINATRYVFWVSNFGFKEFFEKLGKLISLQLVLAARHRSRGNEEEAEGIDCQGEISKNFEKLKILKTLKNSKSRKFIEP